MKSLLTLTVLLALGVIMTPVEALNTFMSMVAPSSVDCYFVRLKVNENLKLSMIVEHDEKDLPVTNIVDLMLYDPENTLIKTYSDVEHMEVDISAKTEGYHLYCYFNKHKTLEAPVSFSVLSPEENQIFSKDIDDILKNEEGKDLKGPVLAEVGRLDSSIRYLQVKAEYLKRRTLSHRERILKIRRAIIYWKFVQFISTISFTIFQVFCTKRFVNSRRST